MFALGLQQTFANATGMSTSTGPVWPSGWDHRHHFSGLKGAMAHGFWNVDAL